LFSGEIPFVDDSGEVKIREGQEETANSTLIFML
jgi:hypothetical protein